MKKIIIGILILLSNNIYSQEVKSLSLEECIKIGLENSKSLKISASKVKSVEAKYKETEVAEYPTLKFTAGYTRLSDVGAPNFGPAASSIAKAFSPILDNYSTKITLNQPIFTGFRLSSATEIAEYNKNASILEFKKDEKELILNIRTAYWNYYRALKLKENIQQNITMVEAHLNDVENFI
jgi:outer membrane protein